MREAMLRRSRYYLIQSCRAFRRLAQSEAPCGSIDRVRPWKSRESVEPFLLDLPISATCRLSTCRPSADANRNRGRISETSLSRSKIPHHKDGFLECPGALGFCGFADLQAGEGRSAGRTNQRRPASAWRHPSATSLPPSRGPWRPFRTATTSVPCRKPAGLHFRKADER
jgi:hypothetical protein